MNSVFFGLVSALSWGTGDFAGGLASRRASAYRIVLYGEVMGLVLLLAAAAFVRQPAMPWTSWAVCALAGAAGASGLVILYQAMADGQMSIAAPVSALMAAVLPVAVAALTESLPGWLTFAGFVLALAAIWMISHSQGASRKVPVYFADLRQPLISGVCFGFYFILMHQGSQQAVLGPMIAARCAGAVTLLAFVVAKRQVRWPEKGLWPLVILNAAGDIGGNAFFILAGQAGRLDVASVLGSLYPAATVILAGLILKERLGRLQILGVVAALAAIVLIAV